MSSINDSISNQVETSIEVQLTNRNRKTVFFRGILVVPMAIFIGSFTQSMEAGAAFGGLLFAPALLALLVRGVYPSYVLSFNKSMLELNARISAYALLLTDEYPSIEANPNIKVELPDIEGGAKLNRYLPLVKWLLALPLYIVGVVYVFYGLAVLIFTWFTILFTGKMPAFSADVLLGVTKYWNRVYGYAFLLVTDEYPSFSL